jgi:carboxylesterase type B
MIDGCSAGAGSTANHVVNAASWPFFSKASGNSGMFAMWNAMSMADGEATYAAVLKNTGCADVACLEGKSTHELSQAAKLGLKRDDPRIDRIMWGPVIDGVDTIAHPWELAQRGHHFKGPLLLGTARDEGVSFCGTTANMSRSEFESWGTETMPGAPLETLLGLYSGHPATSGEECALYAGCVIANHSEFYWASAKLTGDIGFHCGSRFGAQWLSGSQPVYLWSYEHEAEYADGMSADSVPHCSETNSIYRGANKGASVFEQQMAAYWRSFAKYGSPNTAKHPDAPEWPAYTNGTDSNLVFDSPIRTEVGLRKAQCDVCAKYDMCQGRSK